MSIDPPRSWQKIPLSTAMKWLWKYSRCFTAGICVLLQACASPAMAGQEAPLPKVLHVAFSSRVFPDVDRSDAKVAMELWARELSRKAGIPQARVTIFQSAPEIAEQLKRGDIHLVTLPAMEFIAQRGKLSIVPAYIAANKSGKNMENLLLVRRNSGFNSVRALRGRILAIPPNAKNDAAAIWLNILLLKEGVRQPATFFANIIESPKPSQSLMGVFFKKYDGAVVTRSSYETCRTLNPQLGRDLAIIAESRSLASEVTCLPDAISPQLRQAIHKAAGTLHESAVGKQMMTLFQIDRVQPFRPADIAGLEELLRQYNSNRDAAPRSRKH